VIAQFSKEVQMQNVRTTRTAVLLGAALVLGLLAAFYAVRSSGASAAPAATRNVVKSVKNKTLGKTILVNRKGMTLYSLSAETRGRFICTNRFCLSLWTPLLVPAGTKPAGAHVLSTIKRPDSGRTQVTYKGLPLYTFNEDSKPGDVKGNGFKDVGTWRPASPSASAAQPPSGGGYHY
jgi:predicted lipoprotein with Yx(FWY)xxD motif